MERKRENWLFTVHVASWTIATKWTGCYKRNLSSERFISSSFQTCPESCHVLLETGSPHSSSVDFTSFIIVITWLVWENELEMVSLLDGPIMFKPAYGPGRQVEIKLLSRHAFSVATNSNSWFKAQGRMSLAQWGAKYLFSLGFCCEISNMDFDW